LFVSIFLFSFFLPSPYFTQASKRCLFSPCGYVWSGDEYSPLRADVYSWGIYPYRTRLPFPDSFRCSLKAGCQEALCISLPQHAQAIIQHKYCTGVEFLKTSFLNVCFSLGVVLSKLLLTILHVFFPFSTYFTIFHISFFRRNASTCVIAKRHLLYVEILQISSFHRLFCMFLHSESKMHVVCPINTYRL
jgi:hypothetical protein